MPQRHPETPENLKKGLKSPCSCFYFRARTGGAIANQRPLSLCSPARRNLFDLVRRSRLVPQLVAVRLRVRSSIKKSAEEYRSE